MTTGVSVVRSSASPAPPPINYATLLSAIPEYRIALEIDEYGLLPVTVIGCLANCLALLVLVQLCHIAMYNYMAVLAVVDTSVLIGPCFLRWLLTQDVDIRARHTSLCRVLYFQSQWSFAASAWILVAMTLDRFVAIAFPLRARLISTPKRARIILAILAVALTIALCHFFFSMHVDSNRDVCVGYRKYDHFLQSVWPWIDATIYSFAPFFLLLVFNVLIIVNHRKYARVNATLTGPSGINSANDVNSRGTFKSSRRLTILLFTVTFSFIGLTAPRALLTSIRHEVFDFMTNQGVDFNTFARYTLISSVVNILMFINHGINFFLYCLTGKKFRQQMTHMINKTYKIIVFKRATATSSVAPSEISTVSFYIKQNNSVDASRDASLKNETQDCRV